jgi:hypothetical protein
MIKRWNQNIVFRGARGAGKSYTAMKWVAENIKNGQNVIFICGIAALVDNTKRMLISRLEEEGLIIRNVFQNVIITDRGGVVITNIHSPVFRGHSVTEEAIVIDDADFMSVESFRTIQYSRDTKLFITGADREKTMELFTINLTTQNHELYHEASYIDMLREGLITEEQVKNWKTILGIKTFDAMFGPWTIRHNKDAKYVLENYFD